MWKFNLQLITVMIGAFFMFQGCGRNEEPALNDKNLIAELNVFISNWHQYAAESDHAKYIGAMAENGIYIGTDAKEYWTTKEFSKWSKPYFDQKKGWNLVKLNRNIYLGDSKQIAWFDELLTTGMGLCRGSGILQKKNGEWQLCHYVLSPTVPNDLINQVKSLKASEDSLTILVLSPSSKE